MEKLTIPSVFLITSAIGTRFGVFSRDQRVSQTVATVESVRQRIPDARVTLVEMGGESPTEGEEKALKAIVNVFIDFTRDENVRRLYNGTHNWDIVKNATEMLCFRHALGMMRQHNLLQGPGRLFKLSGRYQLTDEFDIGFYLRPEVAGKIVFKRRMPSQFPIEFTLVPLQYMSRLWSFPFELTDEVIAIYEKMLHYMYERVNSGGYVDIEHCLFKFMDPQLVLEVDKIGVAGVLGANARLVSD